MGFDRPFASVDFLLGVLPPRKATPHAALARVGVAAAVEHETEFHRSRI
jgi:hypothetical protein